MISLIQNHLLKLITFNRSICILQHLNRLIQINFYNSRYS